MTLQENTRTTPVVPSPRQFDPTRKNICLNVVGQISCLDTGQVATAGTCEKIPDSNVRRQNSGEMAATLDARQEIIAVCSRLGLRLGIDDLLTLVHRFLRANCSKSDLTRCLKHHNVSRLPALNKPWPAKPRKDAGTCFYYSRIVFPARFYSKVPLVVDLMVDSICRMVRFQITVPPHGSALAFVKNVVARSPMKVAGIIAENPVSFLSSGSGFSDDARRHLHMLQQFCAIRGIACDVARSIPYATLRTLEDSCRRVVALDHNMADYSNGHNGFAADQSLFDQIVASIDIYHKTPLNCLKGQSPDQAMAHTIEVSRRALP